MPAGIWSISTVLTGTGIALSGPTPGSRASAAPYSPVRLLLADGTPSPAPGADELFRRRRRDAGNAAVLPETSVQFGVLTFLGSAALLTIPLRPLLSRIPPPPGLALSFALFLVLRDVNKGFRPCRCPASVSAPELVCEHALRRAGLPRSQLRLLGLLSPAAVAVSLLDGVLSLPSAA